MHNYSKKKNIWESNFKRVSVETLGEVYDFDTNQKLVHFVKVNDDDKKQYVLPEIDFLTQYVSTDEKCRDDLSLNLPRYNPSREELIKRIIPFDISNARIDNINNIEYVSAWLRIYDNKYNDFRRAIHCWVEYGNIQLYEKHFYLLGVFPTGIELIRKRCLDPIS